MDLTRRQSLAALASPLVGATPPSRLADGEQRVPLNGVVHWRRIAGAARGTRPLVVVHGGPGGNAFVFERLQGPHLERRRTVVYYDQRGGGRSDAPPSVTDYAMETLVADLDALVGHLGQPQIDLLGFSFGAELALEYAVAHGSRVARLILQSPNAGDYRRMAQTETFGFQALARGDQRAQVAALAATTIGSPAARLQALWATADDAFADRFHFHKPDIAAKARRLEALSGFRNSGRMNAVMFDDARPRGAPLSIRARTVTIPTLVMVGAYDRTTGVDVARDLAETLPSGRLAVFAASAHFPCYEAAAPYAAAVDGFLRDV